MMTGENAKSHMFTAVIQLPCFKMINSAGHLLRVMSFFVLTGVHTSRWISTHGIALNCNIDLSWFDHFVPCGIEGKGVTSLSQEANRNIQPQDTIPAFIESFQTVFDCVVLEDDSDDLRLKSDAQSSLH